VIIAVVGDVVARAGREALDQFIPKLKEQYSIDGLVINGENLAGGFGITKTIYNELIESHDVDAITLGNHWHDNKDIYQCLELKEKKYSRKNHHIKKWRETRNHQCPWASIYAPKK